MVSQVSDIANKTFDYIVIGGGVRIQFECLYRAFQ